MTKTTPAWRIAVLQVSPSIPTQAAAEDPFEPDGVGTMNSPMAQVKFPCYIRQDVDETDGSCRISCGMHITRGQDRTSPSGVDENDGSSLLRTVVELGLTALATARNAGT